MQLVKKPITIEATQFFANDKATQEHVNFGYPKNEEDTAPHEMDGKHWVGTPLGNVVVVDSDWIVLRDGRPHSVLADSYIQAHYAPALSDKAHP